MSTADTGLTFQWPDARHVSFALPGFIALSVLAHAASFYIFQITYPPSAHIVPPPAQVSLLAPGSPENEALLRWIEAEDPAVAAQPPEVTPAHLFDRPYVPSFAEVRAQPQMISEAPAAFAYPSALKPLALLDRALPRETLAIPATAAPASSVRFSDALARRAVTKSPPLAFHTEAAELQPARFLLAVSDRGEVRYVFLQNSSGDRALDEQAETQLRQTEFAHDGAPLSWGMATYSWGAEINPRAP